MQVAFEPVPGHRFSIQLIMLCVLMYVRTGCGLRTVVDILGIFDEVLGESFGKTPCYNSVANWVRKLGLSIYQDDTPISRKYGVIIDESITVNKEKLLLVLGFNAEHEGRPLGNRDVPVLDMRVGEYFKRDDVKSSLDAVAESVGTPPEYGVSDGAHNLRGRFQGRRDMSSSGHKPYARQLHETCLWR